MRLTRGDVEDAFARFECRAALKGGLRRAAVAIVLHNPTPDETAFVLTKRHGGMRNHPGQWAIPGGRLDGGESVEQAALRELAEEVGVSADDSDVVGVLDDFVSVSGYCITPVVLWLGDGALDVQPEAAEVARLYVVPLGEIDVEPRFVPGDDPERPIIQIPMLGALIHAPTGAVIYQLRELVLHGRVTRVNHFDQPGFARQ